MKVVDLLLIHKQTHVQLDNTYRDVCLWNTDESDRRIDRCSVLGLGLLHDHHAAVRVVGTVIAHASKNSPGGGSGKSVLSNTEVK